MYFAQMNPFGGIIDFISSGATLLAFDCIKKKKKKKKSVFYSRRSGRTNSCLIDAKPAEG